jgi:trans-2,3-dihydro-3-hydroxyanthranilate isomerase
MAERALSGVGTSYLFVFTPHAETPQGTVHSRMFALEMGIAEDPATGAASGPLGCYLVRYGLASGNPARIVSEQGFEIGRPSLLYITIGHEGGEINRVEVGGTCAFMGEGTLTIEE